MQSLYEFPLNEKNRSYLRIEHLLSQLSASQLVQDHWQHTTFFESLFSLIELFERNDVRTDLLKDMEKHESQLVRWSQHPEINNSALQSTLEQVLKLHEEIAAAGRIGASLKEDKFLSAIRPRFTMTGGSCCFDLPQLHYWINQPQELKEQDINSWLTELMPVSTAINLTLKFIREGAKFSSTTASNGVFSQTAEGLELIRIKCPNNNGYYPSLSGNKHRFTLRFIAMDSGIGSEDIEFYMACC